MSEMVRTAPDAQNNVSVAAQVTNYAASGTALRLEGRRVKQFQTLSGRWEQWLGGHELIHELSLLYREERLPTDNLDFLRFWHDGYLLRILILGVSTELPSRTELLNKCILSHAAYLQANDKG